MKIIKVDKYFYSIGIVIIIMTAVLSGSILYCNSIYSWEQSSLKYLNNRYDGEFELIRSYREDGYTICEYVTVDTSAIEIRVKCRWDGVYTPWGTCYIWPERQYIDNLEEELSNFIGGSIKVYNANDKEIDDVVEWIEYELDKAEKIYQSYDISSPDINFKVEYEGKIHEIRCRYPLNKSILKSTLLKERITK